MERYPAWDETVKILTFPRGGRKIVAWRDFKILDENSSVIGIATSEWMMVDLATRKLLPVLQSVIDAANIVHEPVFGEENFEKVRFPAVVAGDVKRATFAALNGHIDLNGHVNNVHYVEWMLEPLYCALDKVYPRDIDIVFRSETFAGDRVEVEVLCEAETGCVYHRVFSGSADRVVALTKGTCV
jgi:acyl-ACP thioesterase